MGILGFSQIMRVDSYASLLQVAADAGQLAMDMSTFSTYLSNGTTWLPLGRVIIKKDMSAVNAKNVGTTLIYTLEQSNLTFYPFAVVPRASGPGISGVTTGPTMTFGSNSPNFNNIGGSSVMSNVLASLVGGSPISAAVSSPPLAGGTQIFANVTVGAIATNYTAKFDILGYYDQ